MMLVLQIVPLKTVFNNKILSKAKYEQVHVQYSKILKTLLYIDYMG